MIYQIKALAASTIQYGSNYSIYANTKSYSNSVSIVHTHQQNLSIYHVNKNPSWYMYTAPPHLHCITYILGNNLSVMMLIIIFFFKFNRVNTRSSSASIEERKSKLTPQVKTYNNGVNLQHR